MRYIIKFRAFFFVVTIKFRLQRDVRVVDSFKSGDNGVAHTFEGAKKLPAWSRALPNPSAVELKDPERERERESGISTLGLFLHLP